MADVTAAVDQIGDKDDRYLYLPVKASQVLYPGIGVSLDSGGYAQQAGDDASTIGVGVVEPTGQDTVTGTGSDGGVSVRVRVKGIAKFAASAPDQSWVGKKVYFTDNHTVGLSASSTNKVLAGTVVSFSGSVVEVILPGGMGGNSGAKFTDNTTGTAGTTLAAGVGVYQIAFPVNLATVADGDVVTAFVIPHKFKILALNAYCTQEVTTAAKLTSLNAEITATDVTGGVVALTSANLATLGAKVSGSAVTALNTGAAAGNISIEASSTTAFAEGQVMLVLDIQNMDTADAMASVAKRLNELG